jgi:hypothetical protein
MYGWGKKFTCVLSWSEVDFLNSLHTIQRSKLPTTCESKEFKRKRKATPTKPDSLIILPLCRQINNNTSTAVSALHVSSFLKQSVKSKLRNAERIGTKNDPRGYSARFTSGRYSHVHQLGLGSKPHCCMAPLYDAAHYW